MHTSVRRTVPLLALFLVMVLAPLRPDAAERRDSRRATKAAGAPQPRLYKSRNFHVMTDLAPEKARELLQRLETMLKLVSAYFGRPNPRPIEMYVFDSFDCWPEAMLGKLNADGVAMVRQGGGLTITEVIRSENRFLSRAVVYAGSDHGTPQHEAVHAYCGHAFGAVGPVWYAEGMAEVGNYWRENDKSVNADPEVIEYLKSREPRPLNEIVDNPLETTGDSWQNYAWRWALCHLLGFNENYTRRFKPLGMALLARQDVDFWKVYGSQAQEIEFEYRQFLKDLEPGYRCDLTTWDWKTKFQSLRGSARVQASVRADRGWQASRLRVTAGTEYSCKATGTIRLSKDGEAISAGGTGEGKGRLMGVLFSDYQLSEPFELPADGAFSPKEDGDLYLRCQDDWGSLADNSGRLTVQFRVARTKTAMPAE